MPFSDAIIAVKAGGDADEACPMYESWYGFSEKPFTIVPNPRFLYRSEKHANALTYLEYALGEGTGFTLLTGEIGTGKTTLIRHILNQAGDRKNIAVVFNTNVNTDQLFELILREFEIEPVPGDKARNLDLLNHFLINCYARKIDPVLIIDEAQNLTHETLEDVRMLTNLQNDERHLLQIILVGQPELKAKMEHPALVQLNQRVNVRYHLTGLSLEETREYVATRLRTVGGPADLFDGEAVALIHEAAQGVPRVINLLCDSALVYGFADEVEQIDAGIVEQVLADRGTEKPAAATDDGAGAQEIPPALQPVEMSRELAAYETKLVNLAKHFKRFQIEHERQMGALEEELADLRLNLEKERRERNSLQLTVTRLSALCFKEEDGSAEPEESTGIVREGRWRLFSFWRRKPDSQ